MQRFYLFIFLNSLAFSVFIPLSATADHHHHDSTLSTSDRVQLTITDSRLETRGVYSSSVGGIVRARAPAVFSLNSRGPQSAAKFSSYYTHTITIMRVATFSISLLLFTSTYTTVSLFPSTLRNHTRRNKNITNFDKPRRTNSDWIPSGWV